MFARIPVSPPNFKSKQEKKKKDKCNMPSGAICGDIQHGSDRAQDSTLLVLYPLRWMFPLTNVTAVFTCLARKQNPCWFYSNVILLPLSNKKASAFLGVRNAKVKLCSRAALWWEREEREIAACNPEGASSQTDWKKYISLEAQEVLLSRSATYNWESLRGCDFLCLKCCLTFLSEHSTNVLGNPQA